MADISRFRLSENIEDRRRTPFIPTPGVFGNGVDLGNVFDNGLLTGLKPEDFVQAGPTPLGNALGLESLTPVSGSPAPTFYQPQGISSDLSNNIIRAESGGNPNATNPNSSASGLGQFIDSTWLATIRQARPDLAGKSDSELLALKTDPQLSREMTEAYANQNKAFLAKNGVPVTDGTTYLAHFAGPGGALKVLQANPDTPVTQLLKPDAIEANPFLARMTARDLQAWADKKMGAKAAPAAPAPVTLAAPANGLLSTPAPAAPAGLAPQEASAGLGAPQQAAMQAPSEAPPIFFAPRRAPDLSKLKTTFKAYRG